MSSQGPGERIVRLCYVTLRYLHLPGELPTALPVTPSLPYAETVPDGGRYG
jgi:hypothetical protein